eukprot:COSAG01_NODE_32086_length_586_cov_2.400411_1_plen_164_part_10
MRGLPRSRLAASWLSLQPQPPAATCQPLQCACVRARAGLLGCLLVMTATVTAAPPWGSRSDGQTGYLPRGSPQPSPQSRERPLGEVLSSTDNSWGISPRIGVIADDDRCAHWPPPVSSWDAHVYFDEGTVEEALSLRRLVCDAFPHLTVNRPYRSPIGPHPTSM